MEKSSERIIIRFSENAFDKETERSGIRDGKKYTKRVQQLNRTAEAIDRYDDFASLTLKPSDFAESENGYGIPKNTYHTGKDRILPHQVAAATAFLKELRGFGLLADVVGSGKTYEACTVLSELAVKGKIDSLLLVVPAQVYNTWISVLEEQFGLGRGVLHNVGAELSDDAFTRGEDGILRPKYPMIVKAEDFVKWREHSVANILFDVIVIDEAHNLCAEEGEAAKALKLLSIMMITKKRTNKTYCVLLSATPHSGNLENMFRLWYFIRCKGGDPDDFDEKDDSQRTEDYCKEKRYYRQHICRGAATVMDFINKVRNIELVENHSDEFTPFLESRHIDDFSALLEGEKKNLAEEFLSEHEKTRIEVYENIARAYHNGVLRSIMIRQPNDRIRKGKSIENLFFFPAEDASEIKTFTGIDGKQITVNTAILHTGKAIHGIQDDYTLSEYIEACKGNLSSRAAYANFYFNNGLLNTYGLNDNCFDKKNSMRFYWNQMSAVRTSGVAGEESITTSFVPVYDHDLFDRKMEKLCEILEKNKDQRVILFFDYDVRKDKRCYDDVLSALKKDERFIDRIVVGDNRDREKTENLFNQKEDTILVVVDSSFTEGANLQKSNIIINFQVTPNPLAMEQRIGRIFRLGQENDVTIYSFADMTDLEGYVLMYFTAIGLMTSNSGDAAIIAGSNNDRMITIRCRGCGKVKLLSKEDYEAYKKADDLEIYCSDTEKCRQTGSKGLMMEEINGNEIKCDTCGNVIKRQDSEDGGRYYCLSRNNIGSGVMCNQGEHGDRQLYCRKICAISHCDRFLTGTMAGKCAALNYYRENPAATDSDLAELCEGCGFASSCYSKCRIGFGADAISSCRTCSEATCIPAPHIIDFDEKWSADCPVCRANGNRGRLHPVVAKTFETYIRSAFDYQQDGGKSFCLNLEKEVHKVSVIREILSNDKMKK